MRLANQDLRDSRAVQEIKVIKAVKALKAAKDHRDHVENRAATDNRGKVGRQVLQGKMGILERKEAPERRDQLAHQDFQALEVPQD